MTVRDLEQLFYLSRVIDREKEKLEDLRSAAGLKSPLISDMPRAPGVRDKIGETVPAIIDQEAELIEKIRAYSETKKRLEDYIETVPIMRIRLILQLRYLDKKTWQEVADAIGGRETEYTVKQACYRYVNGETVPIPGQISIFDGPQ